MNNYAIIRNLGDGSFGSVIEAKDTKTGEKVAIKIMKKKYFSWEECLGLREVKSLKRVNNHVNIIRLKEVIRENDKLHFVFEFADGNLYQKMKDRNSVPFPIDDVKRYTFEMLQGLAFMHMRGYFHRDMKPENLLLANDVIKIADFGLARETRSLPPYTDYVSTRWYRAPEVLLRSTTYSSPVDIWAIGTIIVELLTLLPLFPGESEIDEIFRICAVCGVPLPDTPSSETSKYSSNVSLAKRSNFYGGGVWPEGLRLAAQIGFKFKPVSSVPISQFIPTAPDSAIEMVADMLLYDPHKRPTASESLKYQWFEGMQLIEEVSTQKEVVKEEIASPKTAVLKQTIPKHNESESEYTEQESLISMIIPKARIQTKSQLYDTPIIHEPIKSQPTGTKAKHYDNPLKAIESKTVLQSIKAKSRQNPADQIRSSITNLLDPQRSSNAYRREEPKESPRELNPYLLIGEQKRQSQHIQKPAQKLPLIQANMHMNGMNVINQRKKSNIDRSPVKSFFTDFFKTENSPTKSNIMLIEPSYPYESTFMNTSSFQSAKKAYGTAGTTKSIEIPRTEASNEFILPPLQNVPKKQGLGNVKSGKRRSRTLFGIN